MFGLISEAFAQVVKQPVVVEAPMDPYRALLIAGAVICVIGAVAYFFWNRNDNDYE